MCMMCEEEAMYQMYLAYLAKKAAEPGAALTTEERGFLRDSGFSCDPAPLAPAVEEPVPQKAS